jgi:Protein of unknown function (DUF3723)
MSHLTSSPANTSQPDEIIGAETTCFMGMFRVSLAQIDPHPYQRALNRDWVTKLATHMTEIGVDKANHPIKVLIRTSTMDETVLAQTEPVEVLQFSSSLAHPSLRFEVFDGQHRVAAWKVIAEEQEPWWYARVYSSRESLTMLLLSQSSSCTFQDWRASSQRSSFP